MYVRIEINASRDMNFVNLHGSGIWLLEHKPRIQMRNPPWDEDKTLQGQFVLVFTGATAIGQPVP